MSFVEICLFIALITQLLLSWNILKYLRKKCEMDRMLLSGVRVIKYDILKTYQDIGRKRREAIKNTFE